jgi:translation initiation factor 3 subunit A
MGIDVNDLEVSETPESIMLSTVSGDQSKDRMDRAVVTPWLKFLWQSYRNVLDATKYIARLEPAYHSATLKTFQFCVTYNRKTEFRRICDILRSHCLNAKYTQQRFDVNLNSPDTIQRNLESRFVQLDIAIEFELWHEAFKSVEDIHNLLMASKEPPKPVMMANYYEKLIKLCMVSGDHLFHSAAWNHYSFFERFSNKNLPEKHQSHIASMVLLSALAIPIITTTNTRPGYVQMDEHHISKWDNLSRLMGLSAHPTRTGLLKEALNKGILSCVLPEIRDMYNILEVQFHPLSICKKAGPIMIKLSKYPDLSKYLRPLQEVILTRLLQQLSQVYTTVKLDFFLNLASFPASFTFDALAIEKFIMNGCSRGELNIRIDHASNSFTFQTSLFVSPKNTVTEGIQSQSSPVDLMCTQLSRLGISLHGVVQMVDPCVKKSAIRAKEEAVCRALKGVEEEHRAAIIRTYEIERLKEDTEDKIERQEELAVHEKIIEAEKKVEAEKKRAEMEIKRREQEKQKRIRNEIKRDQVKRLAEGLHDKSAFQLNDEEIEKSKVKELENLKVIAMQKERKVFLKRLGQLNRRVDHAERAYRTEEILLLGKDYENQQKSDNAFYEASQKAYLNNTKLRFDKDIKLKKRLSRISDDQNIFKEKIEERRRQVTETLRIKADQAIKQEKQERIALWRQKRDEILKAYQAEQAEIARNEREEHEGTERERKEREEREARIAKEEEEYAERKRYITHFFFLKC